MPDLGPTELIIIAAVVMVLFGSKKLPGAAKSLGQSMRIFRSEVKGMKEDEPAPPPVTVPRPLPAAEQPQTVQSQAVQPQTVQPQTVQPVDRTVTEVTHEHTPPELR